MGLRLYLGGPEHPLFFIPEQGLDETQTGFLRDKIIEVAKGKVDRGKVKDLTNFEWDKVCIFVANKISDIDAIGDNRLKNAPSNNQKSYVYLVFEKTGVRQMTVRLKVTNQLGYYQTSLHMKTCFPQTAIFYIKQKNKSAQRLLLLN